MGGGSRHAGHLPRPACIYLAGPSPLPVCCTVAACPGQTEPQCPVRAPSRGGCPLKLTPPRPGRAGVTHWTHGGRCQCGHGRHSVVLQAPEEGSPPPALPWAPTHAPGSSAQVGSPWEAVWLRGFRARTTQHQSHARWGPICTECPAEAKPGTESRLVVTRAGRRGTVTADGYGVPFGGDEAFWTK